jgi:signal transduction histidine kinase/uncharacterized protein HemY
MGSKRFYSKIFACSILFSMLGVLQGQSRLDSLLKSVETVSTQEKPGILNQIAEAYLKISPEKAESYADEAIALSEKLKIPFEEAQGYKTKSSCYLNQYRYSEALSASKNALEIFLKNGKIKESAQVYSQMGLIYKSKHDYTSAIDNYTKAIDYFGLVKDSSGIATVNGHIGSLYLNQNDYGNALRYYQTSLQMRLRIHDFVSAGNSYFNIALVCREKGAFDEALQNLANALSIYEKYKNSQEQANVLNLIGGIYLKKNDPAKAIGYYEKSLAIREKSGVKSDIAASYNNLGLAYRDLNNQTKALECLTKAFSIRKEMGDRKSIANSLNLIGGLYYKARNFAQALTYYLESLKISMELEEKAEVAAAYTNIANIYSELGNYDKALAYFSEALAKSGEINDQNRVASLYQLIGNTYSKLKNYDEAISYFKKSLDIRQKLGDLSQVANSLNNIGGAYSDMGKFSNALNYYNEALTIRKKLNEKSGISTSLNNIGNLYLVMNNANLALDYFNQALKLAQEIDFTYNIALCSRKIGEIYLASKNYDKAFPYLENTVKLGNELSNSELKKKGYWDIYTYYLGKSDYKLALENYLLYNQFNDSIVTSMTNKQLLDMQVNFEISRKDNEVQTIENEVAVLRKDKQLNEMTDLRRKQTIIVLLVLTLLILSLGILYFNRYQLKKRASQLLQEKYDLTESSNDSLRNSQEELKKLNNTKDKFFSIIAHDIKNPLGGLISITDMMKKDFHQMPDAEKEELFEVINKTSLQLYNLLENLLHWSRSQTGKIPLNPTEIKIFELAENNIELMKASAEKKNIMIINTINQNIKVKADKDMITLVLRNLISNAIKFTRENGKIVLESNQRSGFIDISVEDNGVGIPRDDIAKLFRIDISYSNPGTHNETGTGLGLILCKEFITKHNGKIWVESDLGKGAKFTFSLPSES